MGVRPSETHPHLETCCAEDAAEGIDRGGPSARLVGGQRCLAGARACGQFALRQAGFAARHADQMSGVRLVGHLAVYRYRYSKGAGFGPARTRDRHPTVSRSVHMRLAIVDAAKIAAGSTSRLVPTYLMKWLTMPLACRRVFNK